MKIFVIILVMCQLSIAFASDTMSIQVLYKIFNEEKNEVSALVAVQYEPKELLPNADEYRFYVTQANIDNDKYNPWYGNVYDPWYSRRRGDKTEILFTQAAYLQVALNRDDKHGIQYFLIDYKSKVHPSRLPVLIEAKLNKERDVHDQTDWSQNTSNVKELLYTQERLRINKSREVKIEDSEISLEQAYQKKLSQLPSDLNEKLKRSQAQWEVWRDTFCESPSCIEVENKDRTYQLQGLGKVD